MLRQRLLRFYATNDPAACEDLDAELQAWEGEEQGLLRDVEERYGARVEELAGPDPSLEWLCGAGEAGSQSIDSLLRQELERESALQRRREVYEAQLLGQHRELALLSRRVTGRQRKVDQLRARFPTKTSAPTRAISTPPEKGSEEAARLAGSQLRMLHYQRAGERVESG
eukprot:Hpha_TRINITY_DN15522_c1_g5::TRINITY_DN15522_c1_g5_i2::g.108114::m.108114